MKIPKKIEPDNLKSTIVQLLFDTTLPPELITGVFGSVTKDYLYFVTAPAFANLHIPIQPINSQIPFHIGVAPHFVDFNEQIKVEVYQGGITFNMNKHYIGWDKYLPFIEKTVKLLFEGEITDAISRIGVRYISQFDHSNLIDNFNVNLSVEIPFQSIESMQVKNEYIDADHKTILTLINKKINHVTTSIIDIDVIRVFDTKLKSPEVVIEHIESGHKKQKAAFFSLIKPNYLVSLNPQY